VYVPTGRPAVGILTVNDGVLVGVSVAGAEYTVLPDNAYRLKSIVMFFVRLVLLKLTLTASGLPTVAEDAV